MTRYALGVNGAFTARHYLVGGDFGDEGSLHAHDYRVEVVLEGDRLDAQGFVADIVAVREVLSRLTERYRGRTLNDLPEFSGVNPGCEAFARVVAEGMRERLDTRGLSALSVKIWESDEAWASCRVELSPVE